MKEKGLATAPIVFVVIIIVAVAGIGVYFLTRPAPEGGEGTGPGGLPLYPGVTSSSMSSGSLLTAIGKELPAGVEASAYTTTASENGVLSWYRTEMSGKGWTKENDNAATYDSVTYGLLYYEKENKGAIVIAMQYMGTTVLILEHGPKTAFVGEPSAEPGTDLADVPRYPGSTMTSYENVPGDKVTIYYSTTAGADNITSWYSPTGVGGTKLIEEYGWRYLQVGLQYDKSGVGELSIALTTDGYKIFYDLY